MKLIFAIKKILYPAGYITGNGPLALDTRPTIKNEYLLDKFVNNIQEKRFRESNSSWKAITIKKL